MCLMEKLHRIKRNVVAWYKKYFTIEGQYTCVLPDKVYLKKLYKHRLGRELNLKNPKTYTEKCNWLKLYDRRPEYTVMVDKYKAREYIADKIGEQYLVPLLGAWDSPDEIDFDALPNEFVLKCNHDNGVIICRDKNTLNREATKQELASRLQRDYYKKLREWPYKNVPRKIICEKLMKSGNDQVPLEYKVFCFDGVVKFILVVANRFGSDRTTMDTYDEKWNHLDLAQGDVPLAGDVFPKPACFEEICALSKQLSKNIPTLRVDFNMWEDRIYFGELTVFDSGGMEIYKPQKWDDVLGSYLTLPRK